VAERFPILVSSAGRRGALVGILQRTLRDLVLEGPVIAADASPLAAALHLADVHAVVPRQSDPGYVDALLELCVRHGVRLVVPTHDGELPILAAERERFAAIGACVSVSAPAVVAIAGDKDRTHAWLVASGFPTVRQASPQAVLEEPADWSWPLVMKPRLGSAGLGVEVVSGPARLAVRAGEDVVVQELAEGTEHTIDVLVLADGRCHAAVPRRRIEVRAGEVSKGVTVRHAALEELARAIAEALPGAFGVLNVQVFLAADGSLRVIEINARYGGGYPLADAAGAHLAAWTIEELLGREPSLAPWRDGLVMLRYDAAVFVDASSVGLP
jgi:carbamoyl-phosphate synthase large subunit